MNRSVLTLGAALTLVHLALIAPLAWFVIGTAVGRAVGAAIGGGKPELSSFEHAAEVSLSVLVLPCGQVAAVLPHSVPEPLRIGVGLLNCPLWGFGLAWLIRYWQRRRLRRIERQAAQALDESNAA